MPIHKRGKTWHYAFAIRGRRYRGAIPEARTKAQAERVESQKREEVYDGTYGRVKKEITFRAFVEEHYLPLAKGTTRYFSRNVGYQSRILIEEFGSKLLGDLSHFSIEKWLLTLREQYSGVTINHFCRRLATILNHARASGYLDPDQNPMRLVHRVEELPRIKRRLGREEEGRLLQAAHLLDLDHVGTAVIILLETGMRPMELFEMKPAQLNLAEGIIRPVSYKIGRRQGGPAQPRERIVPLSDRARIEFERLQAAAFIEGRERLYPYRCIKKGYAAVCAEAGVADFWLRWCRDEASSRWNDMGIDPFTIAKLLGHASPKMSMTYVKDFRDRTVLKMNSWANATKMPQGEEREEGRAAVNH